MRSSSRGHFTDLAVTREAVWIGVVEVDGSPREPAAAVAVPPVAARSRPCPTVPRADTIVVPVGWRPRDQDRSRHFPRATCGSGPGGLPGALAATWWVLGTIVRLGPTLHQRTASTCAAMGGSTRDVVTGRAVAH